MVDRHGDLLLAEGLADEVAEADGNGQRAARMLLHLVLDAGLQAIEVGKQHGERIAAYTVRFAQHDGAD